MRKEEICEKCGKEMKINSTWDQAYDKMDRTNPDPIRIRRSLADKGIPKYICESCGNKAVIFN